ncbi:hypothetical protein L3Q82_018049 [Scortum barcoo]|uniref:Uncharacterized protein n=1 Tax=Scortum barcoo TaxID=214431 RepID=A0ACB8VI81_9TELE|nr:hypothetical protein L3Q82_018049 [Scortum barcoo]
MINHVFHIHGLPTDIVSDRGPQFVSSFWKEFCQLLCATVSLPSSYHPESNGQTEGLNQELETCLRYLVAQNQTSWSDHLMWIEYAHNSLPTAATKLSPFQVVHGYQPPLFRINKEEVTVPSAMPRQCRNIWAASWQMLLQGQDRMKTAADRHRRTCRFIFTPRNSPLGLSLCMYLTFHISKLKPVHESPLVPPPKPPPKMVDGGPVYKVKKLLAVHKRGQGRQFLDWEGYGPEERSWIPASFIVDRKGTNSFANLALRDCGR